MMRSLLTVFLSLAICLCFGQSYREQYEKRKAVILQKTDECATCHPKGNHAHTIDTDPCLRSGSVAACECRLIGERKKQLAELEIWYKNVQSLERTGEPMQDNTNEEHKKRQKDQLDKQLAALEEQAAQNTERFGQLTQSLSDAVTTYIVKNGIDRERREIQSGFDELERQVRTGRHELSDCSTCKGVGNQGCEKCSKSGKVTCIVCSGAGTAYGSKCNNCNGKGSDVCLKCFGSGKSRCHSCSGTGLTAILVK